MTDCDVKPEELKAAEEHPYLMERALDIKLRYAGHDLTAAIAVLLMRLDGKKPGK